VSERKRYRVTFRDEHGELIGTIERDALNKCNALAQSVYAALTGRDFTRLQVEVEEIEAAE